MVYGGLTAEAALLARLASLSTCMCQSFLMPLPSFIRKLFVVLASREYTYGPHTKKRNGFRSPSQYPTTSSWECQAEIEFITARMI